MDRLSAQITLLNKLMAEPKTDDLEARLSVEAKKLVELAGTFPKPPSASE